MTTASLQIHPWTVLGIDRDASTEEIRSAFREKSKKHHPDRGGDEWAFRLVQQAFDALQKGPASHPAPESPAWNGNGAQPVVPRDVDSSNAPADQGSRTTSETVADPPPRRREASDRSWLSHVWPHAVRWLHTGMADRSHKSNGTRSDGTHFRESSRGGGQNKGSDHPGREAWLALGTVDVELVWIRFPTESEAWTAPAGNDHDIKDSTLSVCLVVTWPSPSVVDSVADYPEAGETLRAVIESFESLKHGAGPAASRSRIEAGQFIGWLSYPNVIRAESALIRIRERLVIHGLSIRLNTRQELLPYQFLQCVNRRSEKGQDAGRESAYPR